MRRMPPLNPLKVFECVARRGSFTKAAEELFVSQSAVSRQIATLEDYLGVKLFYRQKAGVGLTKIGESYYKEIGPAFLAISSATERIKGSDSKSPIKLQVYTTFAAKWLIKRLHGYNKSNPDRPVKISTNVAPVDFSTSDADAAIQLCEKKDYGEKADRLFDDIIEPVCNPSLIEDENPLVSPEDIFKYPLLQSRYRRSDFKDWLEYMGSEMPEKLDVTEFPSSLLAYQGAVDGLGITMGQVRMLQDELKAGSLIRPFDKPLVRPLAYYIIYRDGRHNLSKLSRFREWLMREVTESIMPKS